jgi:hypothetical protein
VPFDEGVDTVVPDVISVAFDSTCADVVYVPFVLEYHFMLLLVLSGK